MQLISCRPKAFEYLDSFATQDWVSPDKDNAVYCWVYTNERVRPYTE